MLLLFVYAIFVSSKSECSICWDWGILHVCDKAFCTCYIYTVNIPCVKVSVAVNPSAVVRGGFISLNLDNWKHLKRDLDKSEVTIRIWLNVTFWTLTCRLAVQHFLWKKSNFIWIPTAVHSRRKQTDKLVSSTGFKLWQCGECGDYLPVLVKANRRMYWPAAIGDFLSSSSWMAVLANTTLLFSCAEGHKSTSFF